MDTMAMSVPSWISSDKPGKRAGFLWASLNCGEKKSAGGQWKNEIRRLNEVLVSPTSMLKDFTSLLNSKHCWH